MTSQNRISSDALYEEAVREFRLISSRACAVVVIILIMLGISLDYAIYPEQQWRFAVARIIASSFILSALLFLYTETGKRHVKAITFVWLMSPQIMIAWMIYVMEGEASLFYAGLILTIFAIGSLFPVGYFYTVLFGLFTLFFYYVACMLRFGGIHDYHQFFYHSIIILFSVMGSSVFTYFNEKARRQLFELKEEVAEKNAELARTNKDLAEIKGQMLQQEKMAAIGTLAAGLLHEVNNPINFCLMAIEIAREDPVAKTNSTVNECLVDAREGMVRIQNIVSDLKTFAYRKPGNSSESKPFLIEKALASAIRLTGHEIKSVKITQALPADTLVSGDEAAIIGVLINLLSNAALALRGAASNEPAIEVSAEWAANRLYVTVKDNGPGITEENLSRIFEPFFTTREIGKGLGLGLSISYSVIKQHDGTLVAESLPGKWTKMIFDLPRAE